MKAIFFAVVALAFSTSHAFAVSLAVKLACKDDYYAHCSQHAVGSPGVRKCMRDVGPRLSSRCLGALADAGMIKSKRVAKTYRTKTQVAHKPAVRKKYAKKPSAKTRVARKQSAKQRYASKASKKRVAKKEIVRRRNDRKRIAYIED